MPFFSVFFLPKLNFLTQQKKNEWFSLKKKTKKNQKKNTFAIRSTNSSLFLLNRERQMLQAATKMKFEIPKRVNNEMKLLRFPLQIVQNTFASFLLNSPIVQDQIKCVPSVIGQKRKRKKQTNSLKQYIYYPAEYVIAKEEVTICEENALRRWINALLYAQVPLHEVEQLQPLIDYLFFVFPGCHILVTYFPDSLFFKELLSVVGHVSSTLRCNGVPNCNRIFDCLTVLVKYHKINSLLKLGGLCHGYYVCSMAIAFNSVSVFETFFDRIESLSMHDLLVELCIKHNNNVCLEILLAKSHKLVKDPCSLIVKACEECPQGRIVYTMLQYFHRSMSPHSVCLCFQRCLSPHCVIVLCCDLLLSSDDALKCLMLSAQQCNLYAMNMLIDKNESLRNMSFVDTMKILRASDPLVSLFFYAKLMIDDLVDALIYLYDHNRDDCVEALMTHHYTARERTIDVIDRIHQKVLNGLL